MEKVTTEAGDEIEVRRLRLYELDENVPRPDIEPYTIVIDALNGRFRQLFDMAVPREKPSVPLEDTKEQTPAWYKWRTYYRYQEGLVYTHEQNQLTEKYLRDVSMYVFRTCVSDDQKDLVLSADDFLLVHAAALAPEVSVDTLKYVTAQIFIATYQSQPLFDAYLSLVQTGGGSHQISRVWEMDLLRDLGEDLETYGKRTIFERAVLIMAKKIPSMIQALDMEDEQKRNAAFRAEQAAQEAQGGQES